MAQDALITHWSAKRSGPQITLEGRRSGAMVRLPVKKIEVRSGGIFAIDADGKVYELATR